MRLSPRSLLFRLIAGAGLWISAALVIAGFLLSSLFFSLVERDFDRRLVLLMDAVIAVAEVDGDGKLTLTRPPGEPRFDQPFSGWYWQIAVGDTPALKSRSLWDQQLRVPAEPAFAEIAGADLIGPNGQSLRIVRRDITLPDSDKTYVFAVAGDRSEVIAETRPFNTTLSWSFGVLWFGLLVGTVLQVRYGLLPLGRLRRGLADIRFGRRDRLEGEFPDEVMPLVRELNAHLGNIAEIVERARTHVGNLAHSLKTPLSVLGNEAEAAAGPDPDSVRRQVEAMRRRVDHYLARARTAATAGVIGARTETAPVLEALRRTLLKIHAGRALTIDIDPAETKPAFRGDQQDFEEIVGNVMDNACKWARSRIAVSLRADGAEIVLAVDDDGPGLSPAERATAINRGERLDETVPGTGLGLSIVKEIAGLYGGSVALEDAALGGLRVVVRLPAAESAAEDHPQAN